MPRENDIREGLPAWGMALGLAVCIGLVYGQALGFPYVWTDHVEIEEQTLVPRDLGELGRFLTLPKGVAKAPARAEFMALPSDGASGMPTYFRPVKVISYGLDYAWGDGQPWSFHLTNLVLHFLVCLTAWGLLRGMLGREAGWLPEAVVLWQALNPRHVETVCWISARSDSLWGWFGLCSLLVFLGRRHGQGSLSRPWLATGFLLLALGSKESAVAVVGWILASVWLLPLDPKIPLLRRLAQAGLPLALGLALFFGYRAWAIGDLHLGAIGQRVVGGGLGFPTLLHLFGQNLWESLTPANLRLADVVERQTGLTLTGVLGLLAGVGWLVWGFRVRARHPLVLWTALAALASLLPASQLFPTLQPRGERYLYLPALFVQTFAVWGLIWLGRRLQRSGLRWFLAGAAGLMLVGLGWIAYQRAGEWGDEQRLFQRAVSDEPACAECWNNLAYAAAVRGQLELAVKACQAGLAVDRRRYVFYRDGFSLRYLLIRALVLLGREADAVRWAEELVGASASPASWELLAELYLHTDRPADAWAAALAGLRSAPRSATLSRLAEQAAHQESVKGFSDWGLVPRCGFVARRTREPNPTGSTCP